MSATGNLQGYATIPRVVLHDPDLSVSAKMVYLILSSHVGKEGIKPSHKTIADGAGVSVSTVKRELRVLRDRGLIRWTTHMLPETECKTVNSYELISATAVPQQLPIAQPEPTSSVDPRPDRTIDDPGPLTQDVGAQRTTNERTSTHSSSTASSSSSSSVPFAAAKRGSRLPENWQPTADMVAWAVKELRITREFGQRETEKFVDYWLAKAGRDATKVDWERTWKNWMRTAVERSPHLRAATGPSADTRPAYAQ